MGNARTVEELYTAHARLVRSICRSVLRDREEAEDAVQQTFLSAQRALANGSSPREPAAWLATIARNECFARVRERMREPLAVEAEPTEFGADAHSAAVSRYEVATLREALADLPRAQREAILLRELRGLSYDEVGRALSVTTAAVESLIFRARRTLQVRLSEALTAFSPFALLSRLLGAGGGDSVAPAVVAKVTAIGFGAAILAGGAALGPRAFGVGHSATKTLHSTAPVHVRAKPPVAASAPARIWSTPSPKPAATQEVEHEAPATENVTSDVTETSTPESSSPESENETSAVPTVTTTPATPPSREPADSSHDSGGSDDPAGSDD